MARAVFSSPTFKRVVSLTQAVNACDNDGKNALWYAVESSVCHNVRLLLAAGANPNFENFDGPPDEGNAFATAAMLGHKRIVAVLLDAGANIDAGAMPGGTALCRALVMKHHHIARYLLNRGAAIEHISSMPHCPPIFSSALCAASSSGFMDIVDELLARGAAVEGVTYGHACGLGDTPLRPLLAACHAGHAGIASILLDHGAEIDGDEHALLTPLSAACASGHYATVKLLLERGASIVAHGRYIHFERKVDQSIIDLLTHVRPSFQLRRTQFWFTRYAPGNESE